VSRAHQHFLQKLMVCQTDRIASFNLPASIRRSEHWRHQQKKMQCLVEAFPELETDSEAHIINFEAHLRIGIFMRWGDSGEAALAEFNKSLALAKTNLERCKVLTQIVEVYIRQERHQEGCELLESVLESDLGTDEEATNLIRKVRLNLGEIYEDKGEHVRALEAYEAAGTYKAGQGNLNDLDYQCLERILECLHKLRRHEAILEMIAGWDVSIRDSWLSYASPRHLTIFHIAIKMLERSPFMINCYTGAIKRSAFPEFTYFGWFKLADAYWHVLEQPKKALEIYQRVFRTVAKKLRSISKYDTLDLWREARSNFMQLLYETALDAEAGDHEHILQYLSDITVDFNLKAADRDDYVSQVPDRAQNLLCARICMLLGKTTEARKILDHEFRLSIDLLEDNVGSNDIYAFEGLTQVLAVVGCKEEATLAYSLKFSNVNPQDAAEQAEEADEDSDDEEESKALRDEDLVEQGWGCDGCGKKILSFTKPLYTCLVCPNVDLCTACHADLMADKSGLQGIIGYGKFCNTRKHEYLKGPVNGWKGVKDGVIRYEEKEIKFTVWLENLKDVWKKLEL
jgi:tetratricopeptide (TPR) repeat protein